MPTQKPISSISYNTEAFLHEKLEHWYSLHLIQAYQYICHKGEDGDKDHIHFRLEPNRRLDPMDLQEELKEFVFGQEKPLGCRPFRPSKEEDWILYAVHDSAYLSLKYSGAEKGEKIPYEWSSIVVPEGYDMEIAYIRAKAALAHSSPNLASRLQNGEDPVSLIMQGENPYVVNSISHALSMNDYQRLSLEFAKYRSRYSSLLKAIDDFGLQVCVVSDDKIYLKRKISS